MTCLQILSILSVIEQEFLIWMQAHLSIISLMEHAFGSISKIASTYKNYLVSFCVTVEEENFSLFLFRVLWLV